MTSGPIMLAEIQETTVALLMSQRRHKGEPLNAIITRNALLAKKKPTNPRPEAKVSLPSIAHATSSNGKYEAEVLGEIVTASTLGRLFAEVIDTIVFVAPEVVVRLSETRARTRAYVARNRDGVHGGRTDLPTLKTRSGWWVSSNIGCDDLVRGLRALCKAGHIDFGRDVRFGPKPDLPPT